jgi:tetratricopeptide (TPR) repeat protein
MHGDSQAKPRIDFKKKTTLIIFGCFLFLILMETGLRLGGFILLSIQERRNLQSIRQKGAYRILCLGESTTQGQYPPFLEAILNQRNIGVRFSVIDKGLSATHISIILSQLESYLTEYHPDMVVTMMGINDWGEYLPYEAATTSKAMLFIQTFKTYKLSRLLWLHILTKAKELGFYKPNTDKQRSGKILTYLQEIGIKEAYAAESISLENSFKQAIGLNPKNEDTYIELERLYRNQGKFLQAEDALKKVLKLNPKKSDYTYRAISVLYEEMGKSELAKEYADKAKRLILGYYISEIVNSYHKLKEILDKRGIRLVCMQYPMRSIEPLKKIFEQDNKGIIFVDNERIFKQALQKASYKEYFRDMFAGDFGHCTDKGNRLLAQNIANVILKEVFGRRIQ